jgi:hypothetical protein
MYTNEKDGRASRLFLEEPGSGKEKQIGSGKQRQQD